MTLAFVILYTLMGVGIFLRYGDAEATWPITIGMVIILCIFWLPILVFVMARLLVGK